MRLSVCVLSLSLLAVSACNDDDSPTGLNRPLFQIELDAEALTIAQDDSALVLPSVHDPKGDTLVNDPTFSYESDDTDVADVSLEDDGDGPGAYVIGFNPGTANIIVRYRSVDVDTVVVTITPVPAGDVNLDVATLSLFPGEDAELTATVLNTEGQELELRQVSYSSTDEDVAEVDEDGVVTAIGAGTAKVIASIDEVADTVDVTVTLRPVEAVTVTPDPVAAVVGETVQYTATLTAANDEELSDREIVWSSSNTAVATVDQSGLVTAVGAGSATITATSETKSGTARIAVFTAQ